MVAGRGTEFDIDNNGKWVDITLPPHNEFAFSITFNEDGTYMGRGYLGDGGGTFTKTANTISLYKENQKLYATYKITRLTHNEMEVIVNIYPGIFRFRLQRLFITITPWEDGGEIEIAHNSQIIAIFAP